MPRFLFMLLAAWLGCSRAPAPPVSAVVPPAGGTSFTRPPLDGSPQQVPDARLVSADGRCGGQGSENETALG